jgi:phosphohistidine phosphatase
MKGTAMDLILWRHADAHDLPDEAPDAQADLARPLTARGEKQARRMAEWLNRVLPASTRILVSPAQRCRQTADALDRKYRTVEALLPGTSHSQALDAARWPDSREPVLLVGHQPALGQLAASLLSGAPALASPPWAVRKGAVWWLRRREREGSAEVVLVAVRGPEHA